jgi:hypothetical protein
MILSVNTDIFLNSIKLMFLLVMSCVLFEVGTEFLKFF